MDYGKFLDDAFSYTRNGIFGDLNRWVALIAAVILLGIPMNGYVMRIYRGTDAAPEVDQWGTLFIDGLRLLVIGLIYSIPFWIVWAAIYGSFFTTLMQGNAEAMAGWEPNMALLLLMYAIQIAIGIIIPVASIRFARKESFAEAFNFSAIFKTIGTIGWLGYILALIIIALVIGIPIAIIVFGIIIAGGAALYLIGGGGAAFAGIIALLILIMLLISPLISVFQARYMTRIYESTGPED